MSLAVPKVNAIFLWNELGREWNVQHGQALRNELVADTATGAVASRQRAGQTPQ